MEVNPNGNVTYYTDYSKEFYDNSETSRIKAVANWFDMEYPMYDTYDKLINHKDDINKYKKEYDDFVKNRDREQVLKSTIKEKNNYEKPITLTDSSRGNTIPWWKRIFG